MTYKLCEEKLISYIKKNKYKINDRLPPENLLCNELGFSRFNLREVINSLKTKGVLRSKQGSGTYIACDVSCMYDTLNNNLSMRQIIESNGHKAGVSYFEKQLTKVEKDIAEMLDIDEGTDVLVCKRVRTANEVPVVYTEVYVSPAVSGTFISLNSTDFSFYDVLEQKCNLDIGITIIEIIPRIVDVKLNNFLELEKGTPICELRQICNDINGNPLIFAIEYMKPNYFRLLVSRKR